MVISISPSSFNPLDRVKFVQIYVHEESDEEVVFEFQSPRSGQICSNWQQVRVSESLTPSRFNPLDRVKFVQIQRRNEVKKLENDLLFQSPRSGQICSNKRRLRKFLQEV